MSPEHSPESKEIFSRFGKLLAALATNEIDFAVVGGVAVTFNGYPRLTLDTDILVNDSPENIRKLLKSLERWGEVWARELKPEEFVPQEGSIALPGRERYSHSLSRAGRFGFPEKRFVARQRQT